MRLRTPVKIYLKAIVSLLFFSIFVKDCAFCDFQKELESNKQLKGTSQEAKEKIKAGIKEGTLNRLRLLRKRLLGSFSIIFSAVIVGLLCISVLSKSPLKDMLTPCHIFALLSMICFSWATLGRLGWQGQSIKGDTVFEDLDELIFRSLYWLGALFGVLAVAL
jgi:hypothetical protein